MYLWGLAGANPAFSLSQRECWDLVQRAPLFSGLSTRSGSILRKVLLGAGGIERRHFALRDLEAVFGMDAGDLNRAFEREAPALALKAVAPALERAGVLPSEVDALYVCTCTGYLCPGLSSYIAEGLSLDEGVVLSDLVGVGCGAAVPLLRQVQHHLAADPGATVVSVAVEICSAAFFLDNDPGVLISLCLFGDGASAGVWRSAPPQGRSAFRVGSFQSLHLPGDRELLRFENSGGKLRNRLHKSVPERAASAVARLRERADPESRVVAHAGGRDVLEAIEARLQLPPIETSREVLANFGNMSSPSVLFALERALKVEEDSHWWATSFGAGFSAHSFEVRREA